MLYTEKCFKSWWHARNYYCAYILLSLALKHWRRGTGGDIGDALDPPLTHAEQKRLKVQRVASHYRMSKIKIQCKLCINAILTKQSSNKYSKAENQSGIKYPER